MGPRLPCSIAGLLLLIVSGCATSVPVHRTARAELAAFVGATPRAAYIRFGAPVRETSDGADGRIVRWEWARTSEMPGSTTTTSTTDSSGTTMMTVTTPTTQSANVRFVELFVGADEQVYHYRSNLRSHAEERAARNRTMLYTTGTVLGLIGVAALTCATGC